MRNQDTAAQYHGLVTICIWSSAFVFTVMALRHFSTPSLALLRCLIASLTFGLILAAKKRSQARPPHSPGGQGEPDSGALSRNLFPAPERMKDWGWFLLSGALGFSVYMLAFNKGSETLSPTTSCIIISTAPVLTALLARALFRERLTPCGWAAIALAFGGILVMTLWRGTLSANAGVFWACAATVSVSSYNIVQRKLARGYGALQITARSFFAGTLPLLFFLPDAARELVSASPAQLGLLCFLGVFPSALAYLFWTKALSLASRTSSVTNLMFLTPFLSLVLEYALMAQLPDAATLTGGAAIITGLVLFSLAGKAR